MTRTEILKKARIIALRSRKMLSSPLLGDYKTSLRGAGFEFDQLAEYQIGSDIRFIDWKSSARSNKLLIKEFRQERARYINIIVDISPSQQYHSTQTTKHEFMTTVAGMLLMAGVYKGDFVSLTLYSDRVNLYMPSSRGIAYGYGMLEKLLGARPTGATTNIGVAVDHIAQVQKYKSLCIVISDAIDGHINDLKRLQYKNDILFIRCMDTRERTVPASGSVLVEDIETGQRACVQFNNSTIKLWHGDYIKNQEMLMRQSGISYIDVAPGYTTIEQFIQLIYSTQGGRR